MFFCRVSIALISGGQTNLAVNQMNAANARATAISVKLMFIATPYRNASAMGRVH
jgi:hypothetical protein